MRIKRRNIVNYCFPLTFRQIGVCQCKHQLPPTKNNIHVPTPPRLTHPINGFLEFVVTTPTPPILGKMIMPLPSILPFFSVGTLSKSVNRSFLSTLATLKNLVVICGHSLYLVSYRQDFLRGWIVCVVGWDWNNHVIKYLISNQEQG